MNIANRRRFGKSLGRFRQPPVPVEVRIVDIRALPDRPTFERLARLEPRLAETRATRASADSSFDPCASFFGYAAFEGRGFKPRIVRLVGWHRPSGPPELQTSDAYDCVYRAILDVLEGGE